MDFSVLLTSAGLIGLFSLTFMEIILGIDNIIFISIVAGKLPAKQAKRARNIGMLLALGIRLVLLTLIQWIVSLTYTVIEIPYWLCQFMIHTPTPDPCHDAAHAQNVIVETCGLSWRDIILLIGGLFLIIKSVSEISAKFNGHIEGGPKDGKANAFALIIAQIVALDIVFSFDSILTAVGLTDQLAIMMTAVVIAIGVMMAFSGAVSDFVNRRPSMKILALSFLILIGFMLVLESINQHIDKGYVYFAMAFAFLVELINSRLRRKEHEAGKTEGHA